MHGDFRSGTKANEGVHRQMEGKTGMILVQDLRANYAVEDCFFYLSSSPSVVMAGLVYWLLLVRSISPCLQVLTQPSLVSVPAVQLQNKMLNCLHWTSPHLTGSRQWHLLDDTFQQALKAVVGCGLEQTPPSVVQVKEKHTKRT